MIRADEQGMLELAMEQATKQGLCEKLVTAQKENEGLKTQLSDMASALMHYVDWFGGAHEEDCPGDDTCACKGKPINDAMNVVLKGRF